MKKSLVALATLSMFGSAFADVDVSGGIKLYGVLDQGYQSQVLNNPYANVTSNYQGMFASNGTSRFGVKGLRDLGDGYKGFLQFEQELAPDASTLLPASNRQAFVGLSNENFGSILLGTQETTAYEVWGMDVNGRVEYKPQVWRTLTSVSMQDRANNAIKYITPNLNGFTGHVMVGFAEFASTFTPTIPTAGSANSASEFGSIALKYKGDNLTAAVVHDQTSYIYQAYKFAGVSNAGVSTTTSLANSTTTLVYGDTSATAGTSFNTPTQRDIFALSYDFGGTIVNYIYGRSYQQDLAGSNTTNTVGIRKAFDKFTLAYSYGTGTVTSAKGTLTSASYTIAEDGSTSDATFGAYYNFDKSTQVYLLASKSASTVGYYDGSNQTIALGGRYNF